MSLFLVMKRYDCSLRTFLDEHGPEVGWRTSLVLLTQLLEGQNRQHPNFFFIMFLS